MHGRKSRESESKIKILNNSNISRVDLDPEIYEFLSENNYSILNDNGYLLLNELIDDNAEIFNSDFERVVRKSLSLIYYSDGAKKLSTRRRRLKDHFIEIFEGTKQLIRRLSQDHLLLLKVYTSFFKYRIKFFTKVDSSVSFQIFGDKDCDSHVKLFFDSYMFYILTKRKPGIKAEMLGDLDRSPSPVNVRNHFGFGSSSPSQQSTILHLVDELSYLTNGKDREHERDSILVAGEIQRKVNSFHEAGSFVNSKSYKQNYSIFFTADQKIVQDKHPPETYMKIFANLVDSSERGKQIVWRKVCLSRKQPTVSNVDTTNENTKGPIAGKVEFGIFESYSASRHCGLITTFTELQVIVVRDELEKAGIPEALFDESANDICVNVKFLLHELSSEPVVVFEAIDLVFIN